MTQDEMRKEFRALYELMANSEKVEYMRAFGRVLQEMMDWMIEYKPAVAQDWIERLECIRWKNYLTQKEAEKIVEHMEPTAPWTRDQWRSAMMQRGYETEKMPCYNACALWVVMNMVMSDSSGTLGKYVGDDRLFDAVHDIAVDKLTDRDGVFNVRRYFGL